MTTTSPPPALFDFMVKLTKLLGRTHAAVFWYDAPRVSFAIGTKGKIVAEVERSFAGFAPTSGDTPAIYNGTTYPTLSAAKHAALHEIKRRENVLVLSSIEAKKRKRATADA